MSWKMARTPGRCSEARICRTSPCSDWVLPGMDRIELCRRIRMLGSNGTYVYTVMLTAKDRKNNLLTAMEAGADDYLAKPSISRR